jgi:hypothetical protein
VRSLFAPVRREALWHPFPPIGRKMSSPLGAAKLKNRLVVREKLNIYGFFKEFK